MNLNRLYDKLGYRYQDETLLRRALSHRSSGPDNNERLEFFGDALLGAIIAEALFSRFPEAAEGQLTQMRAQLVRGKTLADIARTFELGDYLNLGQGELKSGGYRRDSILADAVEALIGAMYIDAGIEQVRSSVLAWYQSRLSSITPQDKTNKDAKSQLQEFLQGRKKPLPTYHLVDTRGSEHQQEFVIECEIAHLQQRYLGQGSSRRSAEQVAAKAALDALQSQHQPAP